MQCREVQELSGSGDSEDLENSENYNNSAELDSFGGVGSAGSIKSEQNNIQRQSTPEVFSFNAQFAPKGVEKGEFVQNRSKHAPAAQEDSEESLSFGGGDAPRTRATSSVVDHPQKSQFSTTQVTA